MNIKEYALALKKTNGLSSAINIAERSMRMSSNTIKSSLPISPVFFTKDKKGNETFNQKEFNRTHSFWSQVLHILKTQVK